MLALFVGTLREHGGPQLDIGEFKLHMDLTVALLGLVLMIDAPALVLPAAGGRPGVRPARSGLS